MPNLVRRYTVADLATFPDDGKRYELIRGELSWDDETLVQPDLFVVRPEELSRT